MNSTY